METKIYNKAGKESGSIALPEGIFGVQWNADLIHQVVVAMASNARMPVAHTKGRGEVRGGGKKPWQQKGTGRARHGSTRSPIWKGGGVTHGPLAQKIYARKLNRKVKQKALLVALSRKLRDGEITLVDSLSFAGPKATEAKAFLSAFKIDRRNHAALVVLPGKDVATTKSFGNFGNVMVEDVRNLNASDVLSKKMLVIVDPQAAVEILSKKVTGADDK
ncbi:MAG: 50S ribosomal protein L4 [Patescibacteria group bacterium]